MKTQKLYNKILDSYAIWNGDAWNDENISGAYFYSLEKAANNGYYPIEEKSDREKAIEWWNSLSIEEILVLRKENDISRYSIVVDDLIEYIWRKETQQELREDCDCCYPRGEQGVVVSNHKERPQVDFEMLNLSLIAISGNLELAEKAKSNLKLFFELLSKSSTFAHKAHKELNKLM